jgi:hypothetical protein
MAFSDEGLKVWPVPPDWSNGVQETLTWSTDVMRASASAVSQHRGLRLAPRRTLTFEVIGERQDRRVAEMLLAGHSGKWELPIWHDVNWLAAPLAGGVEEIPCDPAGRDFIAGGRALLFDVVNRWEIVEIDAIDTDHITLTTPTDIGFGLGSRLYPLRRALVQDGAEEQLLSDALGRRSITFDIVEPCDWPVLESPTLYLGHPVLTVRPDESDDPSSSVSRLLQTVDYGTSIPVVHDMPGLGLRAQQSHWKLFERAEHTWFRSLLYTLQGRRVPAWVPSWTADLKPAATVAGGSTTLSIEWAGYTLFGLAKHNRRDLRIELINGTVYYRRINNAIEAGATETLTLSASLSGSSIAAAQIRVISFMALCTLASDSVEIEHVTDIDGSAESTTGWQAVVPDV